MPRESDLRESVELESLADLEAFACNFGAASNLMKQVNKIRQRHFGPFDPDTLREKTCEALEGE